MIEIQEWGPVLMLIETCVLCDGVSGGIVTTSPDELSTDARDGSILMSARVCERCHRLIHYGEHLSRIERRAILYRAISLTLAKALEIGKAEGAKPS